MESEQENTTTQIGFEEEIAKIMNKEKALSFSALKSFLQSPKHFYRYKTEKRTTKAMDEGAVFHMAILQPDLFVQKYWVLDDQEIIKEIGGGNPRGTKAYKEWKQQQIDSHPDMEILSQEDYDQYIEMGKYLRINSATKDLINGLIETEKYFEFEHNGFKILGYIDGEGMDYLIDLKKVSNADFKKVKWVIWDMLYDMQAGIYTYASEIENYYLIFIDNDINVQVVKIGRETLEAGFNKFDVATQEFRRCAEEDLFQSSYEFYNHGYIEI